MKFYARAKPRFGPLPQPIHGGKATAFPMAGSRHAWFDEVVSGPRKGQLDYPLACELAEPVLRRLSDVRPMLCGLTLDRPRIMGIVNVTPDSFSDGGDRLALADAVTAAREMAGDADILDIGGESTRPGAAVVPATEEKARVVPVIEAIRTAGIATPISIDTRKADVAAAALAAGADMVNDVSGLTWDPQMAGLVARRGVPVCIMHTQGTPETMQDAPEYDNVSLDVFDWLTERVTFAEQAGIARSNIVVDPGLGFGKTLAHNLTLLKDLALFHDLGLPVLLGASRKRFIGTIGKAPLAKDRMPGSVAIALHGVTQAAHILRVHDVRATRQAVNLFLAASEGEWDDT